MILKYKNYSAELSYDHKQKAFIGKIIGLTDVTIFYPNLNVTMFDIVKRIIDNHEKIKQSPHEH